MTPTIETRPSETASPQAGEDRFRILFHQSPLAQAVWCAGDGRCLDANQAFVDLLGYPPDELRRLGHDRLSDSAAAGADGRPCEVQYLHKRGHRLALWESRSRIRLPSGEEQILSILQELPGRAPADTHLHLAATIVEHSNEAILITDAAARIISVNPAFTAQTGYSGEEVIGRNPRMLASGRTPAATYAAMWRDLAERGSWQGEVWDRRKDGSIFPKWLTVVAVADESGRVGHYIANFTDLSERKEAAERIARLATHDSLTGLPNRFALDSQIAHALSLCRRDQRQLAVFLIDLDRFKTINDTLGHHCGDKLLEGVAQRLRGSVRSSDIVARLGGDEFVVVLPDIDSAMTAASIAGKIQRSLADVFQVEGYDLYTTPSIGISLFPSDGDDAATLLRNADTAMYHAKGNGRNNHQFYAARMNEAAAERLQVENALRHALGMTAGSDSQFSLHFQPQYHIRSGRITSVEALARWNHPGLGSISPARFIPIAEETGLIQPLGDWVFWEACRQLGEFRKQGVHGLRMAVNLSAQQLRHEGLPSFIRGALACYDLQAGDLELEITESVAMQNPEITIKVLDHLSDMGITLSIDDFGTGYSSLAYLKHLPIQRLKLDRSFVKDLETDSNDAAICTATIALGHSLGLELVAEGVETAGQRDFLAGLGCDVLQGYLYSRPLPAAQLVDYMRRQPPG